MITEYQREILALVREKGTATTQDLVDEFGCRTPYAPRKYVGMATGRMVAKNLLIRVKPGVFTLGKGRKNNPSTVAEGQTTLFEL